MSSNKVSRRAFVNTTGALAAGTALAGLTAPAVVRAAESNGRLQVGIVGPGGRGRHLLKTFFDVREAARADLVAVCDLWTRNRELAASLVKKATGRAPQVFRRLEDLLALKGLDAVLVATPDHAHAQHLTQCLRAGKHVYCEKPFANVLEEANTAIDAYRQTDRVVTIGTQRRSDPRYQAAVELVRSGVLGPIVQVDVVQNAYSPYRWRRPQDVKLLKAKDTDWRAFLMGRTARPFDPHRYLEFRLYRDYSTGIIDQWMTHMIDTVHLLTGETFPRSVAAQGGTFAWKDGRENGDTVHALLEYPQGFLCSYACTLANGFGSGCRLLGRNGTLEYEPVWRLSGEGVKGSKITQARPIQGKGDAQGDMDHLHLRNWLECVQRGRRQTHCTAEHGYQHAVACIMANRALHTGRRVTFDARQRVLQEA